MINVDMYWTIIKEKTGIVPLPAYAGVDNCSRTNVVVGFEEKTKQWRDTMGDTGTYTWREPTYAIIPGDIQRFAWSTALRAECMPWVFDQDWSYDEIIAAIREECERVESVIYAALDIVGVTTCAPNFFLSDCQWATKEAIYRHGDVPAVVKQFERLFGTLDIFRYHMQSGGTYADALSEF